MLSYGEFLLSSCFQRCLENKGSNTIVFSIPHNKASFYPSQTPPTILKLMMFGIQIPELLFCLFICFSGRQAFSIVCYIIEFSKIWVYKDQVKCTRVMNKDIRRAIFICITDSSSTLKRGFRSLVTQLHVKKTV